MFKCELVVVRGTVFSRDLEKKRIRGDLNMIISRERQQVRTTDEARSSERPERTRLRALAREGMFPIACELKTNREDEVSKKYRNFSGREWESGGNLCQRL